MAICKTCKTEYKVSKNSEGIYCSNKCQGKDARDKVVDAWLSGSLSAVDASGQLRSSIKIWVKTRDSNKCVLCGWGSINPTSGKIPVEVDHIDGDHTNNVPTNLRTICPNCHSLTSTWKNTGNSKVSPRGRSYRRKP